MERRGSGFKKILADYEGQVEFDETKMPVFDADNSNFTLTLYNLNYGHNYIMNVNDTQDGTQDGTQGGTQDKLQEQIFDMIKDNPQISTSEMATKLGVGVRTVKRRIKQMTNIVYNQYIRYFICRRLYRGKLWILFSAIKVENPFMNKSASRSNP